MAPVSLYFNFLNKHFLLSTFLLLLFFNSCTNKNVNKQGKSKQSNSTFKPAFNPASVSWTKKTNLIVDSFYQNTIYNKGFSGQFLVAKNGHIIYQRVCGYANKESGWKMSDTTSIHVASISKVLTAMAILRLVDQKKVRLDEKVSFYLPKFPYTGITIRMLLNHRSGLPYYGYFAESLWPKEEPLRNSDVLALMSAHAVPVNYLPNTRFSYCNTNFVFLALVIEHLTKKDFPRAMKELIFKPLEMNHSFILASKNEFNRHAQSYRTNGSRYDFTNLDAVYGDKNVYTTATDLVLFDNAIYTNFISDSLKTAMFKGYSYENPGTNNYGLGWRMKEQQGMTPYFYHTAWWHGSTGIYARLRKEKVTVIALANNFCKQLYMISPLVSYFGNYPW